MAASGHMRAQMAQPIVVDLRNIYRPEDMTRLGFIYESIGRLPNTSATRG